MRALVTGAGGMLGADLCGLLRALSSPEKGGSGREVEVIALGHEELDVREEAAVRQVIGEVTPDVIFHLAALTDVDACERRPGEAWAVNADGTKHIADASRAVGALLVYPSSIAVFDGQKAGPYSEDDPPCPANAYGRSKLAGEEAVKATERYIIARSGWLFGGGPGDKKFVGTILRLAREHSELPVVVDKFGSPTYTRDFAAGLVRLVGHGHLGTYHVVNAGGPVSRYEIASAALRCAAITRCRLMPVTSDAFPLPAARPRMEAALSLRWPFAPLRSWQEALCEYISEWTSRF